ncbi:TPM domain-containing protein [Psychrobacter sp. FDAARGOS_221]|uniref:TPM domain-containing protein n=1 Tax=Psychrobacter sp. FDAARGOS_221 TaxID=1975705 RepID=UPI000BB56F95|nr:TPM domain-containing protein [Psychrobacter sp. FDAARGOS_221]PNK60157.1 TPM domain-containing protein [Psychrobacter sp. FDAARGOS_221]
MQNLTKRLSVFMLLGASLLSAPMSFAETGASSTQGYNDQSIEDMVAIAKAGQENEAINDAVLGNEAIRDNLPNIGEASAEDAPQTSAPANTAEPRQSTSEAVESDKLILNSPVVDQANIFSPQQNQILTQRLRQIYDQGLAQAALVTVPTTNGMDIFQYSMQVADRWQLGDKDTDDGLLILVAVNDRDMYILSGYGLEGVLPDAALNRIIDEQITPSFKQGDYAGGLIKGINQIENRLQTDPEILRQSDELAKQRSQAQSAGDTPSQFGMFLIAMIFGLFLTSVLGRILGSFVATGGFVMMSLSSGAGIIATIFMAVFLWLFLISRGSGGGGKGGRGGGKGGRRRGGVIVFPGGGFGGGGGGFGGGGFGGGGFGGGGGGFGGGGAGGSW